ncbi:MAG: IclR family transcriptional regulator [Nitrospiraceae bacterium]
MEMVPLGGNGEKDVRVVGRIKSLLDTLSEKGACSLKDLSGASGLAISTTSRLLDSLETHGFVERDLTSKLYRLGSTCFLLAANSKPRKDLVSLTHPLLQRLVDQTGEDAGLAELRGTHAVIIDRVDGGHALKIIDVISKPEPLNCGAFRKVLLAHQDDAWIDAYIRSQKFERFTPRTITTAAGIRREIEGIRKRGYATSYGERLKDAGGIAAPVFDASGKIRASIQIVLPVSRMSSSASKHIISAVVRAARECTLKLGGRLPPIPSPRPATSRS